MAFNKLNFSPLGANARRGAVPAHYAYLTADSLATVMASGYFNTISSKLNVGDVIDVVVVDSVSAPTTITAQAFIVVDSNSSGVVDTGQYQNFTSLEITTGLNDANGNEMLEFSATASAVNHVKITNAITGANPSLEASGDDTNIDLTIGGKGTGALRTTSPKIVTSINDTNGNELIGITATSSAVNYLQLANSATGADPSITSAGSDTNVGMNFITKGTGSYKITADDTVAFEVQKDTNVKIGFFNTTAVVQQSKIADMTITYTANNPSITPDGSITIADGSTPTVNELLEFCEELSAKLNAVYDLLEAYGLQASS